MDFITLLRANTVDQAMSRDPLCVDTGIPLRQVLTSLKSRRAGAAIVCQEGVVAGIFTERDFLSLADRSETLEQPIEQFMVRNPVVLPVGATLAEAIRKMSSGGYRHLPIVDDEKRAVGILRVKGIVHYLVEHFSRAVYTYTPETPLLKREGA